MSAAGTAVSAVGTAAGAVGTAAGAVASTAGTAISVAGQIASTAQPLVDGLGGVIGTGMQGLDALTPAVLKPGVVDLRGRVREGAGQII